MSEVLVQIENPRLATSLKRMLACMEGVKVIPVRKSSSRKVVRKKCGMELAMEDIEAGRVTTWNCSVDEMFEQILKG